MVGIARSKVILSFCFKIQGKLDAILTRLQMEPLALDAAAVYDPLVPRRRPTGWDVRGGMVGKSPINPINVQAYSWENHGIQ